VTTDLSVRRHDQAGRYEGWLRGELVTVIDFTPAGSTMMITHTGTEPRWRGQGLAGQTTRAALEDIRERGQRVRPLCSFVVSFMASHPEFEDLR